MPVAKIKSVGMRKLAEEDVVNKALETVTGRARVKRTMWSRRAQEYEAKINSGDLIAISEVVRDLYRSDDQPEQSYSERQLFEQAMDRMSREIAAVNKLTLTEAVQLIEKNLAKSPAPRPPRPTRARRRGSSGVSRLLIASLRGAGANRPLLFGSTSARERPPGPPKAGSSQLRLKELRCLRSRLGHGGYESGSSRVQGNRAVTPDGR